MTIRLTEEERAIAGGEHGQAAQTAMAVLLSWCEAIGAPALLVVSAAHIDGCLYHGRASLDFVERLAGGGGHVRVPTTLNVGSLDLIHPGLVALPPDEAGPARRLMKAHLALGCRPTFTCAPYQTAFRPGFGDQIAWGESNAIVFANSVIGARTNRYGDFIDLCCAMTGRAPAWGLHLPENRRGEILFTLAGLPASRRTDALYVATGLIVGRQSGDRIPVIEGLPPPASEDQLKALGAASASTGSVALFHAVGITPEAPTLAEAFGGRRPGRTITIGPADLDAALRSLSTVADGTPIAAVSLGTPHFSHAEWMRLLPLLHDIAPARGIPIYVNTGRATLERLEAEGALAGTEAFGLVPVADTCTYVTSVMRGVRGAVMTNSGKWAHYAPGNIGVAVAFGELEDCVRSAAAGRVVRGGI